MAADTIPRANLTGIDDAQGKADGFGTSPPPDRWRERSEGGRRRPARQAA